MCRFTISGRPQGIRRKMIMANGDQLPGNFQFGFQKKIPTKVRIFLQ
jgi:hypothetical protein